MKLTERPIPDINQLSFLILFHFCVDFYLPPEYYLFDIICSASDVYAFSIIMYQLVTNEIPFSSVDITNNANIFIEKICKENLRPKFKESIPQCYRNIIEKCWARDPKERPTFDEIVFYLKTNSEFITDKINKEEYLNYIKYIDEAQLASNSKYLNLDDFIASENQTFRKVQIDFQKKRNPSKPNFLIQMGSIALDNFEKLEKIGSGSFGVVYKVLNKDNQQLYAAKISKYEMDQCSDDKIINLTREIGIISQLEHPSILQFIGFNPKNFKNKSKPVIITEFASNGTIQRNSSIFMELHQAWHTYMIKIFFIEI